VECADTLEQKKTSKYMVKISFQKTYLLYTMVVVGPIPPDDEESSGKEGPLLTYGTLSSYFFFLSSFA